MEDKLTITQIIEKEIGDNNPLVTKDFKIKVSNVVEWGKLVYEEDFLLPAEKQMDRGLVTRVYTSSSTRLKIGRLNTAAQSLFLWIVYELISGKDYVIVNKERYMKEGGITSVNTYKKGISDLVKEKFIALSLRKNVFWINPEYFFCGNRMAKYPDNILNYEPKIKKRLE